LQDTFQELKDVLCREDFPVDEDKENLEEDLDETYDEDEVYSLPLDEDIHTSTSPAHQEENMMSYNPFEIFYDALFHECGNEENFQRDLDEYSLVEGLNKTVLYAFPFKENEVLHSYEEVIISCGLDKFVEQPSDIVDDHIDDFIQVGRHRWMWVASLLIEIPFMTLRVALRQRGLKCHLQRTGIHVCMIQIFSVLMMI
jgi:hypothetical protein